MHSSSRIHCLVLACAFLCVLLHPMFPAPLKAQESSRESLEFFETKIRPLLAENCFKCHGADKIKAKLVLSSREGILKGGLSGPAIVPGDPERSLLIKAVRYDDPDLKMPPRGKLFDQQIADLVTWTKMGAPWPKEQSSAVAKKEFNLRERSGHWSLQPLTNPAQPRPQLKNWIQSPVDAFILAKLEENGLAPSERADKRTLLRRVTFDLTGLPPTADEIDAFLKDDAPDAFTRVVERLLASPHYGERWARHWLDLVRYAETHGHEFDPDIPLAFQYRDYLIRAFNDDVPFNQFVVEHIAGDQLAAPRRHPTLRTNESILATGFWWLGEAKHSPVDVRGDQADRIDNQIDVFGKAFLGMTIACARCHDHKFDAISTKDYYALAGYLQSSRRDLAFIDEPAPREKILKRMETLKSELTRLSRLAAVAELEKRLDDFAGRFLLGRGEAPDQPWVTLAEEGKLLSDNAFKTGRRAAVANLRSQLQREESALARAIVFADAREGTFKDWILAGEAWRTSVPADPTPSVAHPALHSGRLSEKLQGTARSPTFIISKNRIHYHASGSKATGRLILDGLQLIQEPIYGGLTFKLESKDLRWFSQDVSMWQGHRAYIEFLDDGPGEAVLDRVVFSDEGPPPDSPSPLLLKMLEDENATTSGELKSLYQSALGSIIKSWQSGTLHDGAQTWDRVEILNWMLDAAKVTPCRMDLPEQKELLAEFRKLEADLPAPRRALAIADGTAINEHVFIRGNHKKLGELVPRRFLEVLGGAEQTPPQKGSGRLELARQMVDPKRTPLLPLVIVNRLWKHHFGEGIVRSPDDFGVLGQAPTHPELLDFLASEFLKGCWSIKKMHRMIVLSSAYQMASRADPRSDEVDPDNKLLHRTHVRRLEAEAIRDAMLAVSGRLDRSPFGPSVPPYLTLFMLGRGRPDKSGPLDGDGRRSIYLGVRRNFLNPMLVAFDYPTPFSTMGRRSVSNVPAQALTMMNNAFVMQQAELWGKKVFTESGLTLWERIERMYVAALGRPPSQDEATQAQAFLEEQSRIHGRDDPRAWTDLAHVLFNVKEFIFIR